MKKIHEDPTTVWLVTTKRVGDPGHGDLFLLGRMKVRTVLDDEREAELQRKRRSIANGAFPVPQRRRARIYLFSLPKSEKKYRLIPVAPKDARKLCSRNGMTPTVSNGQIIADEWKNPMWFTATSAGILEHLWTTTGRRPTKKVKRNQSVNDAFIPEEVDVAAKCIEGAVKKVSLNAYERSRDARTRCIEQ
jgi:hypothetical protein